MKGVQNVTGMGGGGALVNVCVKSKGAYISTLLLTDNTLGGVFICVFVSLMSDGRLMKLMGWLL